MSKSALTGFCSDQPGPSMALGERASAEAAAMARPGIRDTLERLFDGPDWSREPGCSVVLLHGGEIIWRRAFGLARLNPALPITPRTRFRIASITKMIFARTFLALADEGRLSFDDPLNRHLPEAALPWPPTLGQMLSMKSGVLETYDLNWMAQGSAVRPHNGFDADSALALLLQQRQQNFRPGTRTLYSNGAYVLLQKVAERVTGEACGVLMKRHVLDPAHMSASVLVEGRACDESEMATPYSRSEGPFELLDPDVATGASGGIVSTADDMARLWQWLRCEPGQGLMRLVREAGSWGGEDSAYRAGVMRHVLAGREILGHSGGIGGWSCQTLWSPAEDTAVVVLGNRNDISWAERAREVLLTWWDAPADLSSTPAFGRRAAPASRWRALYACAATLASIFVDGADGELVIEGRRLPLMPDGRYRRAVAEEVVEFEPIGGIATAPSVIIRRRGALVERMVRVDATPAPRLDAVGVYRAQDMPQPVHVWRHPDESLQVVVGVAWPAEPPFRLEPLLPGLYRAVEGAGEARGVHVRFDEDASGRVVALTLAMDRTTGYQFERTEEAVDLVWRFPEASPSCLPDSAP